MFEIREIINKTEYNPSLISKRAPFVQVWFYGEWQEMMGRKVRRFEVKNDSEIIGFFQIIKYPLLFSQSFLYIPHGPFLRQGYEGQAEFLKTFHDKLLEITKEENAIFARFDFYPSLSFGDLTRAGFKKVPSYAYYSSYFQPKHEWILDIDKTDEQLLEKMHSKNRYAIRLAENRGVAVDIIKDNLSGYFKIFYELLSKTAKRNKFNLHPEKYYQSIFENCEKNKNAILLLAKYDNKFFAANFILIFGDIAYFLLGGSDDELKNLMAPHLLHWKGIVEARNRGCKIYNFGAVDFEGSYKNLEGISKFKKRFGGRMIRYSDSYDLVLKPFWHRLYNLYKKFPVF